MTCRMLDRGETYLVSQGPTSNYHLLRVSYRRSFINKWQACWTSIFLHFKSRAISDVASTPVSNCWPKCLTVCVFLRVYMLVGTQKALWLLWRVCWNALLATAISPPSPLTLLFLSLLPKCQAHSNTFCAFLVSLWKWIQPFSEATISLTTHRETLSPIYLLESGVGAGWGGHENFISSLP